MKREEIPFVVIVVASIVWKTTLINVGRSGPPTGFSIDYIFVKKILMGVKRHRNNRKALCISSKEWFLVLRCPTVVVPNPPIRN